MACASVLLPSQGNSGCANSHTLLPCLMCADVMAGTCRGPRSMVCLCVLKPLARQVLVLAMYRCWPAAAWCKHCTCCSRGQSTSWLCVGVVGMFLAVTGCMLCMLPTSFLLHHTAYICKSLTGLCTSCLTIHTPVSPASEPSNLLVDSLCPAVSLWAPVPESRP